MKGINDYFNVVFKFIDKAYKYNWLWYFLIGLILLFLLTCHGGDTNVGWLTG